ncbi:hypothetical protein MHU86_15008 [Fragilaria crotonensis]|nr:hypothetical protein MHU86_15008 [Fragilaria crotonensis]
MDYSPHLNNLGAAAVEAGKFTLAIELMREALDAKLASISDSLNGPGHSERKNRRLDRAEFELILDRTSKMDVDSPDFFMSSYCSESEAFLYRKAFFIVADDGWATTNEDSDNNVSPSCVIQSATLLFNLGLIYHMKARRKGTKFMEKSIVMYKMALGLLKDVLNSSSCHVVDARLTLALINNLGEIYFVQGQHEMAKNCFDNLSVLLSGMCASGMSRLVDQNDWSGFVMNSMMLIDPHFAAAA